MYPPSPSQSQPHWSTLEDMRAHIRASVCVAELCKFARFRDYHSFWPQPPTDVSGLVLNGDQDLALGFFIITLLPKILNGGLPLSSSLPWSSPPLGADKSAKEENWRRAGNLSSCALPAAVLPRSRIIIIIIIIVKHMIIIIGSQDHQTPRRAAEREKRIRTFTVHLKSFTSGLRVDSKVDSFRPIRSPFKT